MAYLVSLQIFSFFIWPSTVMHRHKSRPLSLRHPQRLTCSRKLSPSSTAIFWGQIWNMMTQLVNTLDTAFQLKIAAKQEVPPYCKKKEQLKHGHLSDLNCRRRIRAQFAGLAGWQRKAVLGFGCFSIPCNLYSFPEWATVIGGIPKITTKSEGWKHLRVHWDYSWNKLLSFCLSAVSLWKVNWFSLFFRSNRPITVQKLSFSPMIMLYVKYTLPECQLINRLPDRVRPLESAARQNFFNVLNCLNTFQCWCFRVPPSWISVLRRTWLWVTDGGDAFYWDFYIVIIILYL